MNITNGQYGYGYEGELEEYMEIKNGLVWRWCRYPEKGCGHYITTHEDTVETDTCERFHKDDGFISWTTDSDPSWLSQEVGVEWLRHQPYCKQCLAHDNSYLFPAWYSISREDIDKFVELYTTNYPSEIHQPFFMAN